MSENIEVVERLARMEAKLDILVDREADHETRLRSLEKSRSWLLGASAVVGAFASVIFGKITGAS